MVSTSVPASDTQRLRIALFSGNYNNVVDGPVKALNRLVGWLLAKGHEILIFAPTIKTPAIHPTGTLVSVPSAALPWRSEYRIAKGINSITDKVVNNNPNNPVSGRIRTILENFNPDLIHLSAPDRLGFSALAFAKKHDIPAVSSFHTRFDTYLQYYNAEWLRTGLLKVMKNFYKRCQHVYVPSKSMMDELHAEGIGDDIRLWARGVDSVLFSPTKRALDWRRSIGIEDHQVAVLFVGRIVLEKGLDIFADAFNQALKKNSSLKALIVGDGPQRRRFEKFLPPESIFLGYQGGNDLAKAYANADIFFNPSITETFGNVTLEAMASGLPTICAQTVGSVSLIEHRKTGLLGKPTAESFLSHITALASDLDLRNKLGQNARAKSTDFNWDTICEGLVENYHQAIFEYKAKNAYKAL